MNTKARSAQWLRLYSGMLLTAAALLVTYAVACRQPLTADVYPCRDKEVHANKEKPKGVDEEVVTVCHGHKVRWRERHQENWSVHFDVSPFVSGVKDIKKGDPDPGSVIKVDQDTGFKYTITVDGTAFDPQIIIMGP